MNVTGGLLLEITKSLALNKTLANPNLNGSVCYSTPLTISSYYIKDSVNIFHDVHVGYKVEIVEHSGPQ